jgi:hypothetical protein
MPSSSRGKRAQKNSSGILRYEISGSHKGVSQGLVLLGFDAVSLCEWFPLFLRSVMPSSSRGKRAQKNSSGILRYEISGSHKGVSQGLGLLEFDAVSLYEWFPVFLGL